LTDTGNSFVSREQSITFTRGNNQKGTHVIVPSHRHFDSYEAELSKKKSTLDTIIETVAKISKSTKEEATECLLRSMFMKYVVAFVSIAMNKCAIHEKIIEKKMDVISTEAMIQEANITNSARIISHHLWQHFGQSLFASEAEHRTYFSGSDFPPTVSTKVLADKMIIPFWYKRPDTYLQSQLKQMIDFNHF